MRSTAGLSRKLRSDYIEMINQALDAIPMEKPSDFRSLADALQKIVDCVPGSKPNFDDQFKENMQLIHDYCAKDDDTEHQGKIKEIIQEKIDELTACVEPSQKYHYIQNQKNRAELFQSDNTTLTLDAAFRRAAYYGIADDLENLRSLGANINAQSLNGSTALHLAVRNNQESNVKYLLSVKARQHIEDAAGFSAMGYAAYSENNNIRLLFPNNLNPICTYDVLNNGVMSYLMPHECYLIREVCFKWGVASRDYVKDQLHFFLPSELAIFDTLKLPLKFAVLHFLIMHRKPEEIKQFFKMLQVGDYTERVTLLFSKECAKFILTDFKQYKLIYVTDSFVFLLCTLVKNLANTYTHPAHYRYLFNPVATLMLTMGLAKLSNFEPSNTLPDELFTHGGFTALNQKLLTIDQVNTIYARCMHTAPQIFKIILSKNGLSAIREKFISYGQLFQLVNFTRPVLALLLSDLGLQAMRESLISPNRLFSNYECLMTEYGLQALREHLITEVDAAKIKKELLEVLFKNIEGLICLRHKLFHVMDLYNCVNLGITHSYKIPEMGKLSVEEFEQQIMHRVENFKSKLATNIQSFFRARLSVGVLAERYTTQTSRATMH